jgi:hypothetical protein
MARLLAPSQAVAEHFVARSNFDTRASQRPEVVAPAILPAQLDGRAYTGATFFRDARYPAKPSPAKPRQPMAHVESSGTAVGAY